ncbi:MAG: NADH:flavin oxidoreductase [Deltaproteobacteria bacterium]|nr:NADH:flavin oxidoreductase [Deltaproteobacteria bacterium]
MTKHAALFEPFDCGKLSLANRIVMAPCTRLMSPGYVPGPEVAAYYRRRVEGGAGLILSEGTTIDHPSANAYEGVPAFHGEASLAGWRNVVSEIHDAGGKFIPQLWHVGSFRQEDSQPHPGTPAVSASGWHSADQAHGKAMTQADIDDVIASYARAARSAQETGCDGVEIHGAHGYLIDNFFWKVTNRREDHYGGSLENRVRFAVEIVEAVRDAVGESFPILFRFSQWKQVDYGARVVENVQELETWLLLLAEAGVDVFDASIRRFWEPAFEGSSLNLAGWARKITGKPSIAVGSVGLDTDMAGQKIDLPDLSKTPALEEMFMHDTGTSSLDRLVEKMESSEFDLIAVGRAMLADPQWANKIRNEDYASLQPYKKENLFSLT